MSKALMEVDLQFFAEDDDEIEEVEELEQEESEESEKEETEESEEAEEEEEESEEKPEKKPVKKDKVTAAIIREKQENKKLRDELAEYRRKEAERAQAEKDSKLRQKLIDNGYSEEEADDRVAEKRRADRLEREIREIKYNSQAEKLASKYPDIYDHLDKFIKIVESSDGEISLSDLCKARLDRSSDFEKRTKLEQETILKKAASKKIVKGEDKQSEVIKFSAADEEAYKFYAARNPGKTRKDYQEILKAKRG